MNHLRPLALALFGALALPFILPALPTETPTPTPVPCYVNPCPGCGPADLCENFSGGGALASWHGVPQSGGLDPLSLYYEPSTQSQALLVSPPIGLGEFATAEFTGNFSSSGNSQLGDTDFSVVIETNAFVVLFVRAASFDGIAAHNGFGLRLDPQNGFTRIDQYDSSGAGSQVPDGALPAQAAYVFPSGCLTFKGRFLAHYNSSLNQTELTGYVDDVALVKGLVAGNPYPSGRVGVSSYSYPSGFDDIKVNDQSVCVVPVPTYTKSPTLTPSPSPSLTISPSWTFSPTITLTSTISPTPTATASSTPSLTISPSLSPTVTASPTTSAVQSGPTPVETPRPGEAMIYPAPVDSDSFNLAYEMPAEGEILLRIWNTRGDLAIEMRERRAATPIQVSRVDASQLASGVYFIRASLALDDGRAIKLKAGKFLRVRR